MNLNKKSVVIGISGGVDSAASLLMLKEQGYDITAVFLLMMSDTLDEVTKKELDLLSQRTGIDILIEPVFDKFEKFVTKPFTEAYMKGDTPSPCTICNPLIKWDSLINVADRVGAYWVATGHYCRVTEVNNKFYLTKGDDPLKDQSYYMWKLSQHALSRMMFPLGESSKEKIRNFMRQSGYDYLTNKKESMGVCFLKGKGYAQWLKENVTNIDKLKGGNVILIDGTVIGVHDGYPFYTLAQKKGLGLKGDQCVVDIDAINNTIIVGNRNELYCNKLTLKDWCCVDIVELTSSDNIEIKVRGIGINPQSYCKVEIDSKTDTLKVTINNDTAWAVTAGQPAVFYIGNRVIGGGVVVK